MNQLLYSKSRNNSIKMIFLWTSNKDWELKVSEYSSNLDKYEYIAVRIEMHLFKLFHHKYESRKWKVNEEELLVSGSLRLNMGSNCQTDSSRN